LRWVERRPRSKSVSTTLVILGLLAGALWALERDRPYLSGVLLAAALAKPTIAAPFVLILVVRAEWRALFALGAFALASSAATYAIVRTSPVEMLYQLSLVGQYLATEGGLSLTRETHASWVWTAASRRFFRRG
jgi:hypothetical protein